jgi:hypothetical protein
MAEAQRRVPRHPKLRSSCDECGAAKLKCDRGQPECGRCISLELTCVYGISRKMGKPPRDRPRQVPEVSLTPQIPQPYSASYNRDLYNNNNNRRGGPIGSGLSPDSSNYNPPPPPLRHHPNRNDFAIATHATDNHLADLTTSEETLDELQNELLSHVPSGLTSMQLGEYLSTSVETAHMQYLKSSPAMESYLTPSTQADGPRFFDDASKVHRSSNGHNCFREAHDILGSLSLSNINDASKLSSQGNSSGSTDVIPLDHVLCINREAGKRLGHLLACQCTRTPFLALLCASIISRILILYQQAAGYMQGSLWDPTALALETASVPMSIVPSSSSSTSAFGTASSSTWSSAPSVNTPSSTTFTGSAVGTTKIAIGNFNVDDQSVETALKMQLLSGEMRRAGSLIDQFTCHNSRSQSLGGEDTFGGVSDLYQSLDSWLRCEHSRISNIMRFKLRELSA